MFLFCEVQLGLPILTDRNILQWGDPCPIDPLNIASSIVSMNRAKTFPEFGSDGGQYPLRVLCRSQRGDLVQGKAVAVDRTVALTRTNQTISRAKHPPRAAIVSGIGGNRIRGMKLPLSRQRFRVVQ